MLTSFDFFLGFISCSLLVLLYLLYQFIQILKEVLSILRESFINE